MVSQESSRSAIRRSTRQTQASGNPASRSAFTGPRYARRRAGLHARRRGAGTFGRREDRHRVR
jgi:hypothetical protein